MLLSCAPWRAGPRANLHPEVDPAPEKDIHAKQAKWRKSADLIGIRAIFAAAELSYRVPSVELEEQSMAGTGFLLGRLARRVHRGAWAGGNMPTEIGAGVLADPRGALAGGSAGLGEIGRGRSPGYGGVGTALPVRMRGPAWIWPNGWEGPAWGGSGSIFAGGPSSGRVWHWEWLDGDSAPPAASPIAAWRRDWPISTAGSRLPRLASTPATNSWPAGSTACSGRAVSRQQRVAGAAPAVER